MNFHQRFTIFTLSIFISFVSVWAQAANAQADGIGDDGFFGAVIQGLKGGRSWPNIKEVPNGLDPREVRMSCDPRRFEQGLLERVQSSEEYFTELKNYFVRCESRLTNESGIGLPGLLKFSNYQYRFLSQPQVNRVRIPLPDGTEIPAIFALRNDPRPRPLVVYKCGVFCSAGESASMKSYLMALFDQSPFNVLLLGNQTGMDYIVANKRVSLAGWSEGHEVLEVGRWLHEEWEYRGRISSLHLMGVSLGGSAAVHASVYNDQVSLRDGRRIFSSVAAICGVVDLQPTLRRLFNNPLVGPVFTILARDHLKDAGKYVSDVPDLLTKWKIPWFGFEMPGFLAHVAATSIERRGIADMTGDDFFAANNFWNLKPRVKTPLMVWASKDDIIVNNKVNSGVMSKDLGIRESGSVGVVNLRYGNHCAFNSVYGAQTTAMVLRSFVLAHSPEFLTEYQNLQEMTWDFGSLILNNGDRHTRQIWKFQNGNEYVQVSFRSEKSQRVFPVAVSDLQKLGARVPQSEAEAQALSREFNTKVQFYNPEGFLSGTSGQGEVKMRWSSAY